MIKTISEFITKDECNKFINQINTKNKKIRFTNSGVFENDKYNDQLLANYFFNKLIITPDTNENMNRANKIIMTGKYIIGNSFNLHTDTGLYYNKLNNEKSCYTLLIYLNDNYIGGETEFYDNNFNFIKRIIPKTGKALIFDINLWHKGNEIISGEKYWIGCEIIGNINYLKE